MINPIEKIVALMINQLDKSPTSLSTADFLKVFEESPEVEDFLLKNDLYITLENKKILQIPAINVLFMVCIKDLENFLHNHFKGRLEPFKEVYLIQEDRKNLVHGLDLFSLTNKDIEKELYNGVSLNIQNTNQLFCFLNKSSGVNWSHCRPSNFTLKPWYYEKNIPFLINYESMFVNNWDKENKNELTELVFTKITDKSIYINKKFNVEIKNISQITDKQLESFFDVIRYKLSNGQIDFKWDEERINSLIESSSLIFKNLPKEFANFLLNVAQKEGTFTKNTMTMIYLKNKYLYNHLLENNITVIDNTKEILPMSVPEKIEMKKNHLENFIDKYEKTDSQVTQVCLQILKEIEFLSSEKGLEYFSQELEQKYSLEKMCNDLIPKILDSYISLPSHIRSNEEKGFLKMTIEQLHKIKAEMEKFENNILENEMRKMKVMGKFLDDKFSQPKAIFNIS